MKEEVADIVRRLAANQLTEQEKLDYKFGRKYYCRNMLCNIDWPLAMKLGWICKEQEDYRSEIGEENIDVGSKFLLNKDIAFSDKTFPLGTEVTCNGPVFLDSYLKGAMSFTFPDGTSRYLLNGDYSKVI